MAMAGAALLAIAAGAQEDRPSGQEKTYKEGKDGKKAWQQPTKEHEWLKQFEGTWEAKSEFTDKDGKKETCTGVETNKVALGGFWLVQMFKGEMDGKPFEGHGMMGYDTPRKKFVMTWVDSMSPCKMSAEGDAETDGKTFTFRGETVDPRDAKTCKHRLVHEFRDADTRVLTFYGTTADSGGERKMGEIKYTRSGGSRR